MLTDFEVMPLDAAVPKRPGMKRLVHALVGTQYKDEWR